MTFRHVPAVGLALLSLVAEPTSAGAAANLDPKVLVTSQEAEAILGAPVTLEVHDMRAIYPGSADFAYQTKNVRVLSAVFYPQDGAEMFNSQKRNLAGMGKKVVACSAGDSCFFVGEQLNALKGNLYFTLDAPRGEEKKLEELARKVITRLP